MPSPKAPKRKRLKIDEHEIVLEAIGHPNIGFGGSGWWRPTSIYSIAVDGIPRGFVCYGYERNKLNAGWKGFVYGVSFVGDGSEPRLQGTELRRGASRDEVAAMFVDLVAKGLAPTEEEANTAVARKAVDLASERSRKAQEREDHRRDRQAAADKAAADLDDMMEGLRSIRTRLSSDLTNFETDALERVVSRLGVEKNRP